MKTQTRLDMNTVDIRNAFIHLFTSLRQSGFQLGVGELLAAFKLAEGDFDIENLDELHRIARLLWCTSPDEQALFDRIRQSGLADEPEEDTSPSHTSQLVSQTHPESVDDSEPPMPSLAPQTPASAESSSLEWTTLPVRAPFTPTVTEHRYELLSYWPISSRSMAYA